MFVQPLPRPSTHARPRDRCTIDGRTGPHIAALNVIHNPAAATSLSPPRHQADDLAAAATDSVAVPRFVHARPPPDLPAHIAPAFRERADETESHYGDTAVENAKRQKTRIASLFVKPLQPDLFATLPSTGTVQKAATDPVAVAFEASGASVDTIVGPVHQLATPLVLGLQTSLSSPLMGDPSADDVVAPRNDPSSMRHECTRQLSAHNTVADHATNVALHEFQLAAPPQHFAIGGDSSDDEPAGTAGSSSITVAGGSHVGDLSCPASTDSPLPVLGCSTTGAAELDLGPATVWHGPDFSVPDDPNGPQPPSRLPMQNTTPQPSSPTTSPSSLPFRQGLTIPGPANVAHDDTVLLPFTAPQQQPSSPSSSSSPQLQGLTKPGAGHHLAEAIVPPSAPTSTIPYTTQQPPPQPISSKPPLPTEQLRGLTNLVADNTAIDSAAPTQTPSPQLPQSAQVSLTNPSCASGVGGHGGLSDIYEGTAATSLQLKCPTCHVLTDKSHVQLSNIAGFTTLACLTAQGGCGCRASSKRWECPCSTPWYKCPMHSRVLPVKLHRQGRIARSPASASVPKEVPMPTFYPTLAAPQFTSASLQPNLRGRTGTSRALIDQHCLRAADATASTGAAYANRPKQQLDAAACPRLANKFRNICPDRFT